MASEGPDVYFEEQVFEVCNPDCFEYSAIVTAELWTERVMIYFVVNEPGAWGHPGNVQSMVVDTGVGQCFEAHWADVNNDGVLEILASCYDTRLTISTPDLSYNFDVKLSDLGREMRLETSLFMNRTGPIQTSRGRDQQLPLDSSPTVTCLVAA